MRIAYAIMLGGVTGLCFALALNTGDVVIVALTLIPLVITAYGFHDREREEEIHYRSDINSNKKNSS